MEKHIDAVVSAAKCDFDLAVEAICLLVELAEPEKKWRAAVIARWPQLEHRISDNPEERSKGVRCLMALSVENAKQCDRNHSLRYVANRVRHWLQI